MIRNFMLHSLKKQHFNGISLKRFIGSLFEYINSHPMMEGMLVLKGGTAINLTIFNLPRLSVDIDLDFSSDVTREEMLSERDTINTLMKNYFESEGYLIKPNSKSYFSLDSWVIGYTNTSGNPDKIKVEINYSLRQHILPVERRSIGTDIFTVERKIYSLSKIELFASKIAALLNRTAARDLYDIYNIVKYGLVEEDEITLLRMCVVFYKLISSEDKAITFDTSVVDKLTKYKIGTDLFPMLRKKEPIDLEAMKKVVKEFISSVMVLTPGEKEYIDRFMQGEYIPGLLFDDEEIVNRIRNHPMALWKVNAIKQIKPG